MAEQTIKTKIALKIKSLSDWALEANKSYVPLKGEVCLCEIPSGDATATTAPTVLYKVGDGTNSFENLNWASALAADVYEWAKAAKKPTYTASEVGAATANDIVNYQLVVSGSTIKLQSKKGTGAWTDVEGQSFTLPNTNTTYTFSSDKTAGAYFKVKPSSGTEQTVYLGEFDPKGTGASAAAAVKSELETKISNIETSIKSGVVFKGKVEDFPASPENGWLVIKGTKEYIYSTDTNGWVELGDEGTHLTQTTADGRYVLKTATIAGVDLKDNITAAELRTALNVADGANKYVLPTATDTVLGGIKVGYTNSGKNYKVQLDDSGNAYVNVPWTDNNNNQTVKVGSTTFGANDAVEVAGGTNITVAADTTNKKITISGKSDADIKTLAEAQVKTHSGVDKVGTVVSVSAGTGLTISAGTNTVNPTIGIDTTTTFILDCN